VRLQPQQTSDDVTVAEEAAFLLKMMHQKDSLSALVARTHSTWAMPLTRTKTETHLAAAHLLRVASVKGPRIGRTN
jgi:hypothetical protein